MIVNSAFFILVSWRKSVGGKVEDEGKRNIGDEDGKDGRGERKEGVITFLSSFFLLIFHPPMWRRL